MNWRQRDSDLDPEARRGRAIRMATALVVVLWALVALAMLPAN